MKSRTKSPSGILLAAALLLAPAMSSADMEAKALVNQFRAIAGVPEVTFDAQLDQNCFEHSRYMAENNIITHSQDPELPFASPAGQAAAQNGNVWLGSASQFILWSTTDSVHGWMGSPGHRFWLLYPTTPTFGFGFYRAANNRAGATLDVLSNIRTNQDATYTGWPIRYPAQNQQGIPATSYIVSLMWRYFGQTPVISSTSLRIVGGGEVAHTATTAVPANHKGILLTPASPLPNNTRFEVTITGTYDNTPFTETWRFATGTPIPEAAFETVKSILLGEITGTTTYDLNGDNIIDAGDLALAPR